MQNGDDKLNHEDVAHTILSRPTALLLRRDNFLSCLHDWRLRRRKKNTINSKCMLWKRTNAVLNLTNVLTLFRLFEWRNERTIRRWFNGREGHFFSRLRPNIREKEIIVHNVDGTKAVENAHSIVICTEFVLPERTKKKNRHRHHRLLAILERCWLFILWYNNAVPTSLSWLLPSYCQYVCRPLLSTETTRN